MKAQIIIQTEDCAETADLFQHLSLFRPSKSGPMKAEKVETSAPKAAPKTKDAETDEMRAIAAKAEAKKTQTVNDKLAAKAVIEADKENPPAGERLDNEPTYENVKTAVLAVSRKFQSKAKAFEILGKYGIEKVTPAMPEEHFGAIIEDCQAALDAAE
jgi:hypothetical protein